MSVEICIRRAMGHLGLNVLKLNQIVETVWDYYRTSEPLFIALFKDTVEKYSKRSTW